MTSLGVRSSYSIPQKYHVQLMCSYEKDVGTAASIHGRCSADCTSCWQPDRLVDMLSVQASFKYNEVIIDGVWYEGHLPGAVQAFMYDDSGGQPFCHSWRGARTDTTRVRRAHAAFLSRYGYTKVQVPLLRYTGYGFEVYDETASEGVAPGESVEHERGGDDDE